MSESNNTEKCYCEDILLGWNMENDPLNSTVQLLPSYSYPRLSERSTIVRFIP